ncbi:hypothetical protein IWW38_000915 [Coemansia aciculifera]|uniref:Uncharacterized protein n=1 Tax=Coemansia aciculifera TaxID=417176 RepID=A0ACC1M7U6_9FUNG|nr:hypothetical protein IWW38_000915 [Coemansia aciculifera]
MRTLASDNRRGRGKKLADPAAAFTQTLTVANVALDSLDAKLPVDRCATHPGSRNDLWCGSCSAAICSHCVSAATGAHRTHSVVKLSAAYDDTYEAIEALQLDLVSHLAETRQRNSLLDDAAQRLAEDYEAALAAMDAQMMRDSARVEAARAEAEAELLGLSDACGSWRSVLKDALGAVQRMMEDLAPAQALAERGRMVRMLGLAAQARPGAWDSELPQPQVSAHVTPAWVFAELSVAAVAELGRRRGHVHVMGDPFSAHGAVWQAKVSRSRTALGEPSLALAVACVEGPPAAAKRAYSVSASVASLGVDLAYSGHWAQGSEHVFSLCLLDSVAANDDGSLAVRVGVQPESFRELALAQAARIEELERRVKRESADAESARTEAAALQRDAADRSRRRRSEARGWATSPRAPPVPQIPLPDPPQIALPDQAKLRRQAPIPFPISTTHSSQSLVGGVSPGSVCSQSSSVLSDDRPGGVLRRLSGWMRTTGRHSRSTQRLAVPAAPPTAPADDADGDWTFLDRTLSPGFEQAASIGPMLTSSASASLLSMRLARRPLWPSRGLINVSPPLIPLRGPISVSPPLISQMDAADLDEGFAFDGRADIEREQLRVDAARAERRARAELALEERASSLAQRFNKIQLIANTCENARDGFSDGALRRISSELGVLTAGRRRQRAEAAAVSPMRRVATNASDLFSAPASSDEGEADDNDSLCLSPLARHPRRAITMDSRDLSQVLERSAVTLAVSRKPSTSSVSSTSSSTGGGGGGRLSGRITRPGGVAAAQRRNSGESAAALLLGLSPAVTPSKLAAGPQLTPLANRQGGILKAGRTMRAKPARLQSLADSGELGAPPQPWLDPPMMTIPGSPPTRMVRSLSNAGAAGGDDDESMPPPPPRMRRPHQVLRKSVRFPEEQRLLETIRLIDPRAAQSIESRAVSVYEPTPLPLPPPATPSDDDDEEAVPISALAARIRSSPRLAPRVPVADALQYERPPPLPPARSSSRDDVVVSDPSCAQGRSSEDSSSFTLEAVALGRPPLWVAGSRSLYVGPNVASAQSSPMGSNLSESESEEVLVAGATHSAHLYPSDVAAFGDAQIPAIACGRDTAFRSSQLEKQHHIQQGADLGKGIPFSSLS